MYKNQLQELAQRSCFNLPSYICIREGPDHAPRFKAIVNFNGESFETPNFCSTLRQAEHSAAEVALNSLSSRGPSHSLAARIFDETGVYKNLLQEIAQRVGSPLPLYKTFRSGLGHLPVFTGIVELAGIAFTGEPAKNKKQAEKNAALAAWTSLKQLAREDTSSSSSEAESTDELEQVKIARALVRYRIKEKIGLNNKTPIPFVNKFQIQNPTRRPSLTNPQQRPLLTSSKILPLICQNSAPPPRIRPMLSQPANNILPSFAPPYVPISHFRRPNCGIAPPVTVRTAVPVYSAPPPVLRRAIPVYSAPAPIQKENSATIPVKVEGISCKENLVSSFQLVSLEEKEEAGMKENNGVQAPNKV
ncbi:double-stranded RNA-binding protein 2-like [Impatiens glandulifera]|uniref:double-stranded RNA-binding protein 2-like n=1 Tax=Impatiens glandulifera TaxID=253017 RepID=UPI001FB1334A|nr:double-stranded RNA-binding protein 2-like [Impatiens glandulifera]